MSSDPRDPQVLEERIKIGAHIRSLRNRTGLAQEAFAHRAGISRKQMYRLENGHQSVGIDQFIAVYRALGIPLIDVLADGESCRQGGANHGARGGAEPGESRTDAPPNRQA